MRSPQKGTLPPLTPLWVQKLLENIRKYIGLKDFWYQQTESVSIDRYNEKPNMAAKRLVWSHQLFFYAR